MATTAEVRAAALAQPDALEVDHHGFPSFRVKGKIFCTLREEGPRMMVKLLGEHQANFLEAFPGVLEPVPGYWGRKGSTYVDLPAADVALVTTLIEVAWGCVAPKRLVRPG